MASARSPLAAGGRPADRPLPARRSARFRAASGSRFLQPEQLTAERLDKVRRLDSWRGNAGRSCRKWRWPGAARRSRYLGADRRQQECADRRRGGHAGQSPLQ
ncbi:hypothetical protein M8494_03500 [Serratia ureilytica]